LGQYREITREVVIPAKDSIRTWDAPTGSPIKNITIVVNSGGPLAAATVSSLAYEIFYGGRWVGTPFDTDSTHTGGVSQGAASGFTAGTEIAQIVHDDASILPTNRVGPTVQHNMKKYGLPVVLELSNVTAADVTVFVTFVTETVSTNV